MHALPFSRSPFRALPELHAFEAVGDGRNCHLEFRRNHRCRLAVPPPEVGRRVVFYLRTVRSNVGGQGAIRFESSPGK